MSIDITLIPPGHPFSLGELGPTDAARDIGAGLLKESIGLLVAACKSEGFEVQIECRRVVY